MKILCTGGSGFIGSFLVSELYKEGHDVTVLTNDKETKGKNIVNADITDREAMLEIIPKFDIVFHLAGLLGTSELIEKSYEASMVNIIGTINILDGARKNKTKIVHITKPNVWLNTYSITKYASESFAKMYYEQFGVPTVSIKWFNVYGPNQSFHCQKAVPFFIDWALKGKDVEVWGSGEQTGDFIHAEDAVRATVAISKVKELEGTTVDVGSGKETTVNELAELIIKNTNSKSKIIHLPMRAGETEDTKLCADLTVLNSIGFKFNRELEEGIKETIEWYSNNRVE